MSIRFLLARGWPASATLICLLAFVGCSSSSPTDDPGDLGSRSDPDAGTDDDDGNLPPGGGDAGAGASDADTNPPAPPCDETQMTAVQTALDGAHSAKTDIVAAIKTPSCGLRYFTSGPSQHGDAVLHRIASVSKTYTGAVVLSLVEEGLVSLDDPASKWLSDVTKSGVPGGDKIHVRHLLRHQSGLAAPSTGNYSSATTPQALLSSSFGKKATFEPGSKFEYQNINFVALGVIAEKVTGKSLPTLIHERIGAKFGLNATFFEGQDTISGTIAIPKTTNETNGNYAIHPTQVWGAGSIVAAPKDVATWIEQFGRGQFFKSSTVDEIRQTVPWSEGILDYGLATMKIDPSQTSTGGAAWGHFGDLTSGDIFNGNCGYHTSAFYFPDRKTTIVVVQDYEPKDPKTTREPFQAVVKALFEAK